MPADTYSPRPLERYGGYAEPADPWILRNRLFPRVGDGRTGYSHVEIQGPEDTG